MSAPRPQLQGRPIDAPDPKVRRLLDLVAARGEVSMASAMRTLSLCQWRAQFAVKVLEGAGLVTRQRTTHGVVIKAIREPAATPTA